MKLSDLRQIVFDRAYGRCEWPYCDQPADELMHIHHRGMGGNPDDTRNVPGNCLAACRTHHRRFDGASLTASDLNDLLASTWQAGGCSWPGCRYEVEARLQVRPDPHPSWLAFPVCEQHKPVMDTRKPYPYRRRHIQDLLQIVADRAERHRAKYTQMGGEETP